MNVINKTHTIYLDFAQCLSLKKSGMDQGSATAYWSKADKQLYPADRITKYKGWENQFIAAFTGDELNKYIPQYTTIEFTEPPLISIRNPRLKVTIKGIGEADAKVKFLHQLVKNNIIKFQ